MHKQPNHTIRFQHPTVGYTRYTSYIKSKVVTVNTSLNYEEIHIFLKSKPIRLNWSSTKV